MSALAKRRRLRPSSGNDTIVTSLPVTLTDSFSSGPAKSIVVNVTTPMSVTDGDRQLAPIASVVVIDVKGKQLRTSDSSGRRSNRKPARRKTVVVPTPAETFTTHFSSVSSLLNFSTEHTSDYTSRDKTVSTISTITPETTSRHFLSLANTNRSTPTDVATTSRYSTASDGVITYVPEPTEPAQNEAVLDLDSTSTSISTVIVVSTTAACVLFFWIAVMTCLLAILCRRQQRRRTGDSVLNRMNAIKAEKEKAQETETGRNIYDRWTSCSTKLLNEYVKRQPEVPAEGSSCLYNVITDDCLSSEIRSSPLRRYRGSSFSASGFRHGPAASTAANDTRYTILRPDLEGTPLATSCVGNNGGTAEQPVEKQSLIDSGYETLVVTATGNHVISFSTDWTPISPLPRTRFAASGVSTPVSRSPAVSSAAAQKKFPRMGCSAGIRSPLVRTSTYHSSSGWVPASTIDNMEDDSAPVSVGVGRQRMYSGGDGNRQTSGSAQSARYAPLQRSDTVAPDLFYSIIDSTAL